MKPPRITIATVNRNYGRYIEEALLSVLEQGYPDLEYIVLDAASTDNSLAIIRRHADRLAFWRSEPDAGPSAALNFALRRATGEWFYYLNSDDALRPGALEIFARVAALAKGRLWISGGRHEVDAEGRLLRHCVPWRDSPRLFATRTMMHAAEGTFLHVPSLRRHGLGFDESYQSIFDSVLYTRLDRIAPPLYTDACFARMRLHGENRSGPSHAPANASEARRHAAGLPTETRFRRFVSRLEVTRFREPVRRLLSSAVENGWLGRRPYLHAAVSGEDGTFRLLEMRDALRMSRPPA